MSTVRHQSNQLLTRVGGLFAAATLEAAPLTMAHVPGARGVPTKSDLQVVDMSLAPHVESVVFDNALAWTAHHATRNIDYNIPQQLIVRRAGLLLSQQDFEWR